MTKKSSAAKKSLRKNATREREKVKRTAIAENDNLSAALNEYIPDHLGGTDRYLDIVNWNIRYFNELDAARIRLITKIMGEVNADIFVLQEIAEGALEPVAAALTASGAGFYKTAYGSTGGGQRVAFMYDTEWVRTKDEFSELFAGEPKYVQGTRKRIFPRLPFHNVMHAFAPQGGNFDFHLVGVHLKAYMGEDDPGTEQRRLSAVRLVEWSEEEAEDRDIIICGDFNKEPSAPEWTTFRSLEQAGKIRFGSWNKENEGSHWYRGKRSRIDLVIVSDSVDSVAKDKEAIVIPWKQVFESTTLRKELIEKISDHMPVVSRFYFRDLD